MARIVHQALPWLSLVAFGWVYRLAQREAGWAGAARRAHAARDRHQRRAGLVRLVSCCCALLGRMARGIDHPPVDDHTPLPRSRVALFWVVAVSFVLIFMPVPSALQHRRAPPLRRRRRRSAP